MSVHISSWVWNESAASGTDLLVLLALADQANDEGICWPSQDTLRKRTRLSRATVQRRLGALQDAGIIYVIERHGTSNRYGFSHLRVPQKEAGSEGVPQNEAPRNSEAGVPHNCEAEGASPGEAQTVREPSLNRHGTRKRSPETDFPDGFTFDDVREWTRSKDFALGADDFDHFRAHHEAKGSKFRDWRKAWQTWAHQSRKFGKPVSVGAEKRPDWANGWM